MFVSDMSTFVCIGTCHRVCQCGCIFICFLVLISVLTGIYRHVCFVSIVVCVSMFVSIVVYVSVFVSVVVCVSELVWLYVMACLCGSEFVGVVV